MKARPGPRGVEDKGKEEEEEERPWSENNSSADTLVFTVVNAVV